MAQKAQTTYNEKSKNLDSSMAQTAEVTDIIRANDTTSTANDINIVCATDNTRATDMPTLPAHDTHTHTHRKGSFILIF